MSWTLTTAGPGGNGIVTATIRNPILGERWTDQRRQAAAESEGARIYVQDLGVTDYMLEAAWRDLNPKEWSDLRRVLLQAGFRAQTIDIQFSGTAPFPVPLGPGLTLEGVPLSVGQVTCFNPDGIGVGDTVMATAGRINGLRLEQSSVTLDHRLPLRGDTTLVFRLPSVEHLQAGG